MAFARRIEMVLAAALFAATAALSAWLPAWHALDRRVFDVMTVATAPHEARQPIVLVAIDEDSMREIGRQWPWPRSLHAQLIDRMAQGGAAAIALDLLLAEPSLPAEDQALAASIHSAGNVVMAADFVYSETPLARLWRRTEPYAPFLEAGALAGFATVPFDPDTFVRRIPAEPDAFWRQVVKVVQVRAPAASVPPLPRGGEWIRYLGGDEVYDAIPYHLVLKASPEELRTVFQGRIVIVGRDVRANPEIGRAQADLFATPFLESTGMLTSGIRVHAAMVENALSGNAIVGAPSWAIAALTLAAALLSFGLFRAWHPLRGAAWLVAALAVLAGAMWLAFVHENLWLPVTAPAALLVAAYLAHGVRAYVAESRRKREIQQAFGRYVSPHVVERIAANPRALGLDGERREITVMFTDLAGFTALSEATAPEVISRVLVRHFTAMTEIVLAKQGTVVQFMGDGMMAFWGAPLDDPEHALHAVEAAVAMQQAMGTLRAELLAEGLPEIRMRVGLNTCAAIVGNMGSQTRLAYTAMGDGVNLAARLEGANKAYGTEVLMTAATAERAAERVPLKLVDRVRVSGKQSAVEVFTPMALVDAAALEERVARLRREAARVAADGSVMLEKL